MARYFDVTFLTPVIALDAERKGQASFTATNATNASIRGDAVIVPQPGADAAWLKPERPSRHYPVGGSEQIGVAVAVPSDVPAGTYGFKLRMLLGGGVPEEQFDDSEVIQFTVEDAPPPPPPPPPPPKPKFPWWLIVIGVILAVIVVGAIIWWVGFRDPPPTSDTVRIVSSQPQAGQRLGIGSFVTFAFEIEYTLGSVDQARLSVYMSDFPGAADCSGSGTRVVAGQTTINRGSGTATVSVGMQIPPGFGGVAPGIELLPASGPGVLSDFGVFRNFCYDRGFVLFTIRPFPLPPIQLPEEPVLEP